METKGYVYVLTNPCFKENWVKIGQTDNLERRIIELSQATGVPLPFEMYAVLKSTKYKQAETMIHRLIGKLAPDKRINPKREFFNIEPEDAVSIMKDIAGLLEDAEIIYNEKYIATTTQTQQQQTKQFKKSPFKTFYSMGIKDGDVIEFTLDPQYKATVCGERTVMFENKEYFLTPLAFLLLKRVGHENQLGSGFEVFKYDNKDKNLYSRWDRMNKAK